MQEAEVTCASSSTFGSELIERLPLLCPFLVFLVPGAIRGPFLVKCFNHQPDCYTADMLGGLDTLSDKTQRYAS